ncbi:GntR family transcriptional regulator [Sphingomonas sp.]|uniref:GntR family transcriptional regulator n=1 Tax=Sphingomonas sp. TaxID=28214 RepID=UPI0025E737D1|nr:GntR family transcriptional regulator [Sphingomonas sp.]
MTMLESPSERREIERRSLPEDIRESLQERILSGEFRDGEALVQDVLAEEYGVSRMPVREVLRQLEACGLVSMRTHKGAVVTSIPTEQVEELFELRALLEADMLVRAFRRMTDSDIEEARGVLGELEQSYRRGDMASWGRLNWEFHRRLYLPAGRPQTLSVLHGINLRVERYIRLHLLMTDGLDTAEREHREILRLCALRDAEAAVAYLKLHILDAGRTLVAALRQERAKAR